MRIRLDMSSWSLMLEMIYSRSRPSNLASYEGFGQTPSLTGDLSDGDALIVGC